MSERAAVLCFFGLHKWWHVESVKIPRTETRCGRITLIGGGRTLHYRECDRCGKFAQYYPKRAPATDPAP